jgi:hypothetical protein
VTIPQLFLAARRFIVNRVGEGGSSAVLRPQTLLGNAKTIGAVVGEEVSMLAAGDARESLDLAARHELQLSP